MKRLRFIACLWPVGRTRLPILRACGGPFERGMCDRALKSPGGIVRIVAREAQFRTGFHHTREHIERTHLNEASLVVTRFRPWIGKQDEDSAETPIGQRLENVARVAVVDTDVSPTPPQGERAGVRGW